MRGPASRTLRFAAVHLENWRNFTQVQVDLQPYLLLAVAEVVQPPGVLGGLGHLRTVHRPGKVPFEVVLGGDLEGRLV